MYADDAGAGGSFAKIREYFEKLNEYGPPRGYFPERTKSILVMSERNLERANAEFADLGFKVKVVTGARYLGGLSDPRRCRRSG
eukprot:scaffold69828_cov33-Attheya_sp.AAC.3